MGEMVDTIPSILNKCLFVSPDGRRRTNAGSMGILKAHLVSLKAQVSLKLFTSAAEIDFRY